MSIVLNKLTKKFVAPDGTSLPVVDVEHLVQRKRALWRQIRSYDLVLSQFRSGALFRELPDLYEIETLLDARREGEHSFSLESKHLFKPVLSRRSIRVKVQLEQVHQHLNEKARGLTYLLQSHVFDLFRQFVSVEFAAIKGARPESG